MPTGGGYYPKDYKTLGQRMRERADEEHTATQKSQAATSERQAKYRDEIRKHKTKAVIDYRMDKKRKAAGIYYKSRKEEDSYSGFNTPSKTEKKGPSAYSKVMNVGRAMLGRFRNKSAKPQKSRYAAGDTETIDGVTHTRTADGKWLPKQKTP